MPLGDYGFALQFRDLIKKLVGTELEEQRPRYRYGTVTSIDRPNYKCGVQFTGETASVTVSMGATQPSTTGQRVRVAGIGTDRYIDEVFGQPYIPGFAAQSDYPLKEYRTTGTSSTNQNQWQRIASTSITTQFADTILVFTYYSEGNGSTYNHVGNLWMRVKQQNPMGQAPVVQLIVDPVDLTYSSETNWVAIITQNDAAKTTVDLYYNNNMSYDAVRIREILRRSVTLFDSADGQPFVTALPAGTQIAASRRDGHFDQVDINTLTGSSMSATTFNGLGDGTSTGFRPADTTYPELLVIQKSTAPNTQHTSIFRNKSGQTGRMISIQDYNGNEKAYITPEGYVSTIAEYMKSGAVLGYAQINPRTVGDWNTINESGIYMASGAANNPSGDNTWWIGHVVVHNQYWQTQEVWAFAQLPATALPLRFVRRSYDNGSQVRTWGPWIQVHGSGTDAPDAGYTNVTAFQNGWVNYGGVYMPAGYRMHPDGTVRIRGLVKSGTFGTTTTGNIFTMPAKYAPAGQKIFTAICAGPTGYAGAARVEVYPSGDVRAVLVINGTGGTNGYLSLEGISYDLNG